MKIKELKMSLKDTIALFLDDVDNLKLQNVSDEQWNIVINHLKHELQVVGIKVVE